MESGVPPGFVLHEYCAKHHHFDFRLEHEGVLASWAVPKGLPENPGERRLAIEVVPRGARLSGRYILVRFARAGEKDWLVLRPKAGPSIP